MRLLWSGLQREKMLPFVGEITPAALYGMSPRRLGQAGDIE